MSTGVKAPVGRQLLSAEERRFLNRGLSQPGYKLPLFDENGRRIPDAVVKSCLEKGYAEPWFANPIKPDWLVCRLTKVGYAALKQA